MARRKIIKHEDVNWEGSTLGNDCAAQEGGTNKGNKVGEQWLQEDGSITNSCPVCDMFRIYY